jgi:hypothetical protein
MTPMDLDELEERLRRVRKEITVLRAYRRALRAQERADKADQRFIDAQLAAAVRSRMAEGETLDEIAAESGMSPEQILSLL